MKYNKHPKRNKQVVFLSDGSTLLVPVYSNNSQTVYDSVKDFSNNNIWRRPMSVKKSTNTPEETKVG